MVVDMIQTIMIKLMQAWKATWGRKTCFEKNNSHGVFARVETKVKESRPLVNEEPSLREDVELKCHIGVTACLSQGFEVYLSKDLNKRRFVFTDP